MPCGAGTLAKLELKLLVHKLLSCWELPIFRDIFLDPAGKQEVPNPQPLLLPLHFYRIEPFIVHICVHPRYTSCSVKLLWPHDYT